MSADLKKLYSSVIKAHNETPYHFEKPTTTLTIIKAYNPICGDRFDLYITSPITDYRLPLTLHFHGFGCAISKASTSVLIKSIEGKSLNDAMEIVDHFLRFINKELRDKELILPDEFLAFSGVHDFPERLECATLAWKEMKKYLESKNE